MPLEFNTIAVSDNQSQGTPGMRASLVSRELIADSIELMDVAHDFDALVCIVGCDKTVPGRADGAGADRQAGAWCSTAGRCAPARGTASRPRSRRCGRRSARSSAGGSSREELDALERVACPGPGTCAGNFTANTMGARAASSSASPRSAHGMVPADDLDERRRAAAEHGALADAAADDGPRAAFLDRRALRNAMAGIAATGGSTNGLLHLLAIAREAEVDARARRADRDQRPHAGDRQPHARPAATWPPTCTRSAARPSSSPS